MGFIESNMQKAALAFTSTEPGIWKTEFLVTVRV
jgi:hypothetical protein